MSLLFPAYLLGFLGLALPWILHRFSDQQPPEQLFPSKQFLESTTPPVSRKRMLRYKALLALRILSLVLLCLLFAQPWINRDVLPSTEQQHHIVVVDRSLSMRAVDRWDAAMTLAKQALDEIDQQSATLIAFDNRITVLASTDSPDVGSSESLSDALNDLQPGFASGDYGALMQRVDRLAAEKDLPVKLWLISDMQDSALPAQLNALYAPNVAELQLMRVDIPDQLNVHLIADAQSSDGATARVSVSMLASGNEQTPSVEPIERTVQIETSDGLQASRTVSLVSGELSVVQFDGLVLPAQSNPQFLVTVLEPDALLEDNAQVLPIVSEQAPSVVLLRSQSDVSTGVSTAVSTAVSNNATVYLTTALESDGASTVESLRGNAQQVPADTPHLVTGRDLIESLDLDLLQYVDEGNNALVFARPTNLQQDDAPLQGAGIGTMDEAHPLALGSINWLGTEFYNVPSISVEEQDRVLLQSDEGDVILLERETARGRLLILNDPLDGFASNLPLQPAFVELMQAVVRYFDANTSVPLTAVVGERVALPANVQLLDQDGDALIQLADLATSSSIEVDEPGIYTVVSSRGEQRMRAVLDADEANILKLNATALQAWRARYTDAQTSTTARGDSTQASASTRLEESTRQSLWYWLLPVVALLLLSEGWFANNRLDVRRDGS